MIRIKDIDMAHSDSELVELMTLAAWQRNLTLTDDVSFIEQAKLFEIEVETNPNLSGMSVHERQEIIHLLTAAGQRAHRLIHW